MSFSDSREFISFVFRLPTDLPVRGDCLYANGVPPSSLGLAAVGVPTLGSRSGADCFYANGVASAPAPAGATPLA